MNYLISNLLWILVNFSNKLSQVFFNRSSLLLRINILIKVHLTLDLTKIFIWQLIFTTDLLFII